MVATVFYFIASFLGDILAYIFYQQYVDGNKKNPLLLVYAIISAFFVWFFIFKIQDKGQTLRLFVPLWAAGTAVFGYVITGLATKTSIKELFSFQALVSILCIGVGIFLLQKLVTQ